MPDGLNEIAFEERGRDPQDFGTTVEHNMHILRLAREDQGWALSRILLAERLERAVDHVIADSPGTPETVKGYLGKAKRGF